MVGRETYTTGRYKCYDNSNFKNSTSGTFQAFLGMICRKSNYISADCVDGIKKIVVNIMLPIAVFHGLATSVMGKETIFNIGMMFVILCVTFILGFVLKHFIRKPYDKYLPFIACGYEGGMIGYSLYTGLVGVENLSVIAAIDIAALLFTFSIMSNVLVLIEDGKKVSVIEIVGNMPENCNNKSCYAADICNCSYFVDTYSWKIRSIVRDSNHCIYVSSWFDGNTGIY